MIGNLSAGIFAPTTILGDYESIATATGTGSSGTITFSNIPQTYQHLQLRFIGRMTSSNTENGEYLRFNNDSGATSYYPLHYLLGDGSSATAGANGSTGSRIDLERLAGGTAGSNIYGASVIDILDYTNTNKYTTTRTLAGVDRNGAGTMWFASGLWLNTAAVTRIDLVASGAYSFATGSHFALYGIKG